MTTLAEEDELFGASLSVDFYQSTRTERPWQSREHRGIGNSDGNDNAKNDSSGKQTKCEYKYRDPYELLDDVPPASPAAAVDDARPDPFDLLVDAAPALKNRKMTAKSSSATSFDNEGEEGENRYSLGRQLYPRYVTATSAGATADGAKKKKAMACRYPIDDTDSTIVSVVESRSDSEASTRDGNGSSKHGSKAGQESLSSFDRLYDNSDHDMDTNSDCEGVVDDVGCASPNSIGNTPGSDGSDESGRAGENAWSSVRVDIAVAAPTPQRSNRSSAKVTRSQAFRTRHPSSPYPRNDESADEVSTENRDVPSPPRLNNKLTSSEMEDVFRPQGQSGDDSRVCSRKSSKSSGVFTSADESSDGSIDTDWVPSSAGSGTSNGSDDSAIAHLTTFQEKYRPVNWRSGRMKDPPEQELEENDIVAVGRGEPDGWRPHNNGNGKVFPNVNPSASAAKTSTPTIRGEPEGDHYHTDVLDIEYRSIRRESNGMDDYNDAHVDHLTSNKQLDSDCDDADYGSHAGRYQYSPGQEIGFNSNGDASSDNQNDTKKARDASGYIVSNGRVESVKSDYYSSVEDTAEKEVSADDMLDSNPGSSEEGTEDKFGTGDNISLVSEESDIRNVADRYKKHQNANERQGMHAQSTSYYQVRQNDSMESYIKIPEENEGMWLKGEYPDIKRNDSMEADIRGASDDLITPKKKKMNSEKNSGLKLPPTIEQRPISFDDEARASVNAIDMSIVSGDTSYSSSEEEDDESTQSSNHNYDNDDDMSDASDDPTIFPSKALSQMNLGSFEYNGEQDGEEDLNDKDLTEQACYHLSRGRYDTALSILTTAVNDAQERVDNIKSAIDNFHFQKKTQRNSRRSNADKMSKLEEDEYEEHLHSMLRDDSSNLANILNNIGVVYEMKGGRVDGAEGGSNNADTDENYQRAMTYFREALETYRNVSHRYENANDPEVDRTVSNILQMNFAMRSFSRRAKLHEEERALAEETDEWRSSGRNPNVCTQLRMERLNKLTVAYDIETESLGRNHPHVGFTLLKKGELYLEMNHVDMAIKDTRDGIDILKSALGTVHPECGHALVRLADIYNYSVGQCGGDSDSDGNGLVGHHHPSSRKNGKDLALSLYQEAVTPLRESFGKVNNPHLGNVHNCIGILYSGRRGGWKNAMKYCYYALVSYGVRCRASSSPETNSNPSLSPISSRPDVFFVWVNVGCLHMQKSQWQLSLRAYLKAHSAYRCMNEAQQATLQGIGPRRLMPRALKGDPSIFNDACALLAAVLQQIGKAQSMLRQYGHAIETLEEALSIHRVVTMRNSSNRRNVEHSQRGLARILENIGEVQMLSGNLGLAVSRYCESLSLLRDVKSTKNNVEVALVLGAIGRVHFLKGEYAEARVVLKECMREFERVGVPPNNRRINSIRSCLVDSELALIQNATSTLAGQRCEVSAIPYQDKALAIDELAGGYRNSGDTSAAIWFYSEALDMRRRKVDELTSLGIVEDSEIVDVGRTLSNIAQLRRDRREFGAAKVLFDGARGCYRRVRLSPEHPFCRDLIHQVELMRRITGAVKA